MALVSPGVQSCRRMMPSDVVMPFPSLLSPSALCREALWGGSWAWRLRRACSLGVLLLLPLAGCDQLGIETPQKATERQQAEARAIGSACRHAVRAIEDCYTLNPKADKAAMFAGWREMDEYMRENKLEGVTPVVPRPPPVAASKASAPDAKDEEGDAADAPAEDAPDKKAKTGKAKSH